MNRAKALTYIVRPMNAIQKSIEKGRKERQDKKWLDLECPLYHRQLGKANQQAEDEKKAQI